MEDFLGPSKTDPQDPLQSSAPVIPGSDEYLPAPGDEGAVSVYRGFTARRVLPDEQLPVVGCQWEAEACLWD